VGDGGQGGGEDTPELTFWGEAAWLVFRGGGEEPAGSKGGAGPRSGGRKEGRGRRAPRQAPPARLQALEPPPNRPHPPANAPTHQHLRRRRGRGALALTPPNPAPPPCPSQGRGALALTPPKPRTRRPSPHAPQPRTAPPPPPLPQPLRPRRGRGVLWEGGWLHHPVGQPAGRRRRRRVSARRRRSIRRAPPPPPLACARPRAPALRGRACLRARAPAADPIPRLPATQLQPGRHHRARGAWGVGAVRRCGPLAGASLLCLRASTPGLPRPEHNHARCLCAAPLPSNDRSATSWG
jgi:hypothetical protein